VKFKSSPSMDCSVADCSETLPTFDTSAESGDSNELLSNCRLVGAPPPAMKSVWTV